MPRMGHRSAPSARPTHSVPGLGRICGIAGALRLWDCCSPGTPRSCQERPRPESVDPAQDLREQRPWHRHLGQLEHDVAAMAYDPGADLDQLLAQGGQRPMLDPLRHDQCAEEVGEVGARLAGPWLSRATFYGMDQPIELRGIGLNCDPPPPPLLCDIA
jgi:hypothetical protein